MLGLSSKVALFLFSAVLWSYVEYCFHTWVGDSNLCMDLLEKQQKRVCKIVGLKLDVSI